MTVVVQKFAPQLNDYKFNITLYCCVICHRPQLTANMIRQIWVDRKCVAAFHLKVCAIV